MPPSVVLKPAPQTTPRDRNSNTLASPETQMDANHLRHEDNHHEANLNLVRSTRARRHRGPDRRYTASPQPLQQLQQSTPTRHIDPEPDRHGPLQRMHWENAEDAVHGLQAYNAIMGMSNKWTPASTRDLDRQALPKPMLRRRNRGETQLCLNPCECNHLRGEGDSDSGRMGRMACADAIETQQARNLAKGNVNGRGKMEEPQIMESDVLNESARCRIRQWFKIPVAQGSILMGRNGIQYTKLKSQPTKPILATEPAVPAGVTRRGTNDIAAKHLNPPRPTNMETLEKASGASPLPRRYGQWRKVGPILAGGPSDMHRSNGVRSAAYLVRVL
ncbi:hypothetical protein DFH27DRAFT_613392 [Peziza echinospora]|nr:hypothetical protein DFH27DRAFT_613392 [Peziza echinospora]